MANRHEIAREILRRLPTMATHSSLVSLAEAKDDSTSVTLGHELTSGELIRLFDRDRYRHSYVLGQNGVGKSTFVKSQILQDVKHGHGVCVLDPHGDLVDEVVARLPEYRLGDLILLDIADPEWVFGLNIFECRDTVSYLVKQGIISSAVHLLESLLGNQLGPQNAQYLRNCVITISENGGTMADVPRLLLDANYRKTLQYSQRHNREFWQEYNSLPQREQAERRASTLNKFDEFLSTPLVRHVVSQHQSTLDFHELISSEKILLVKLSAEYEDVTRIIGSALIMQLLIAVLSRAGTPPDKRKQFMLYIDEADYFLSRDLATLLKGGRKYGICITLAHQTRALLDRVNQDATLQVGNLICFSIIGSDAETMALQFDATPGPGQVTGHRPRMMVCNEPVAHLVRVGHHDDAVRTLVDSYLRPMHDWVNDAGAVDWYSSGWLGTVHRNTVALGLDIINRFLRDVMAGVVQLDSSSAIGQLFKATFALRTYLKIAPDSWGVVATGEAALDAEARFRTDLRSYILYRVASSENPSRDANDRVLALLTNYHQKVRRAVHTRDESLVARYQVARADALACLANANRFVFDCLIPAARVLAASPLQVPSGEYEPIYELRSFQDSRNEIVNRLTSLEPFTAYCRLATSTGPRQVTIRTLPPSAPPLGRDVAQFEATAWAASHAKFCRRRAEVEAELNSPGQADTAVTRDTRDRPASATDAVAPAVPGTGSAAARTKRRVRLTD